jgi:hypothetical protein
MALTIENLALHLRSIWPRLLQSKSVDFFLNAKAKKIEKFEQQLQNRNYLK